MAIAITLIICATIFGCVFVGCVYTAKEDLFDISRRTKAMTEKLEDIEKTNIELKSAISDCDVFIHHNVPRMSYTIEVHYYDLIHASKEQIIKRMAEEIEKVYSNK